MQADTDRILRDLKALVAIPSVNPYDAPPGDGTGEAAVADWLLAAMARIGLETGRSEVAPARPNIWGRLRGTGGGPTLMLAGHMDTVETDGYDGDPFSGRIADGRLHGRGACDMKGAIAAMLETARLAAAAPPAGDLLLMFVADEEHLMIGSVAAGRGGPPADLCVVGEPTELAVATAHKGQQSMTVTVHGRSVHSSQPELGANAIVGLGGVITALEGWNAELMAESEPHPLCGLPRATLTLIEGGQSHSAVPGCARLTVDRRLLPGETAEAVKAELDTRLAPVAAAMAGHGLRFETALAAPGAPALDTPADHPLAAAALAARAAITGTGAQPTAFPGATDAPNFGCPAVICGPGALAQAHTIDEWIAIDQLAPAAELYLDIARRLG